MIITISIYIITLYIYHYKSTLNIYFYFSLFACIPSIVLTRYITRFSIKRYSYLFNKKNVVIVGDAEDSINYSNSLKNLHWIGINYLGYYSLQQNPKWDHSGTLDELINDSKFNKIDSIYLVTKNLEQSRIDRVIDKISNSTCKLFLVPNVEIILNNKNSYKEIKPISIIDTPHKGLNRILKRLIDFTLTLTILIVALPIFIIIALLIKIDSRGSIFFLQDRYGLDGKVIKVIKFRTMHTKENSAVLQASKHDSRVTKIGRILRKSSLDELPQLINVLIGNMSLVGPRPHAVSHNEYYRNVINGYMVRHVIKPGITGWAQINGFRGETETIDKMEKRIACDIEYINAWSVQLDIKILLTTIIKVLDTKNTY